MPDKHIDPEDYRKSLVDRSKHLAREQNIPVESKRGYLGEGGWTSSWTLAFWNP